MNSPKQFFLGWFLFGVLVALVLVFGASCGNVEVRQEVPQGRILELLGSLANTLHTVAEIQNRTVQAVASQSQRIALLEAQLRLISRSAILRKTASGTEYVSFLSHMEDEETIDSRNASSTGEILSDTRWCKPKAEDEN